MEEVSSNYDREIRIEGKRKYRRCWCDVCSIVICILLVPLLVIFFPLWCIPIFLCFCCCFPCVKASGPSESPIGVNYGVCVMNLLMILGFPARWIRFLMDFIVLGSKKNQKKDSVVEERKTTLSYFDKYRKKNQNVDIYTFPPERTDSDEEEIIMLFIHGGGYIFFQPLCFTEYFRELITVCSKEYSGKFRLRIIAPNYRKAPEYKVDSILFECVEVLKWIRKEYPKVEKIVISGDSAGGNMVALLSSYLRDTKYEIIDKLNLHSIPIYPGGLIYPTKENLEEFFVPRLNQIQKKFGAGKILNRLGLKRTYALGNGDDLFHGKYNYYDLIRKTKNLPSFFIVGATYCQLCCEAKLYSEKLKKSGNEDVEFIQIDDLHGFSTNGMGNDQKSKSILAQNVLRSINNRFINK